MSHEAGSTRKQWQPHLVPGCKAHRQDSTGGRGHPGHIGLFQVLEAQILSTPREQTQSLHTVGATVTLSRATLLRVRLSPRDPRGVRSLMFSGVCLVPSATLCLPWLCSSSLLDRKWFPDSRPEDRDGPYLMGHCHSPNWSWSVSRILSLLLLIKNSIHTPTNPEATHG